MFLGNHDSTTLSVNYFDKPVRAQYLKIVPLQWHGGIAMQLEVLGCYEDYRKHIILKLKMKIGSSNNFSCNCDP